ASRGRSRARPLSRARLERREPPALGRGLIGLGRARARRGAGIGRRELLEHGDRGRDRAHGRRARATLAARCRRLAERELAQARSVPARGLAVRAARVGLVKAGALATALEKHLAPGLEARGFVAREKRVWNKRTPEGLVHVVHLQVDKHGTKLTINVGVFFPEVHELEHGPLDDEPIVAGEFSTRLADAGAADFWWP